MENQPLETDESQEPTTEEQSDQLEELFDEPGQEEVGKQFTLDELNEMAGRKENPFKSKEEFLKHYTNLKSFVGKKQEASKEQPKPDMDKLAALEAEIQLSREERFVEKNPLAKDHIEKIRAFAQSKGQTLQETYDKDFKELLEAEAAIKKETGIGVKSKSRISPLQVQKINKLAEAAKLGDDAAQHELVKEVMKG